MYAQWPVKSLFHSGRIKKKVVGGRHRGVEETTVGDPPSPGNSSTTVHDDDHDARVREDWSDLLPAAYNCKCAASCVHASNYYGNCEEVFSYECHEIVVLLTGKPLTYFGVAVYVGETVSLTCNSSAASTWTYDNDDGSVDYVYWNRRVKQDKPRLSVNSTDDDVQTLIISDVHFNDSGLYDCYTGSGLRTVGYQLIVNDSMYCLGVVCSVLLQLGFPVFMLKFIMYLE